MVFVAEYANDRVSVFTSQGQFVRTFGAWGTEPGQFSAPYGITADRCGLLYVTYIDPAFLNNGNANRSTKQWSIAHCAYRFVELAVW